MYTPPHTTAVNFGFFRTLRESKAIVGSRALSLAQKH
jgi:hypothetical protein